MKKLSITILSALFITFFALYVHADQIRVTIDGAEVVFTGQPPVIVEGRTLVPVRGVFEQLGFEVGWNGEAQQATLSSNNHSIVLTIGNEIFTTDNVNHTLDVPAQIIGGSTMLPIRAVLESVGYELNWFGETQTIAITAASVFPQAQAALPALPNRRLTDEERDEWIRSYWAMGGPSEFELEVIQIVNRIRQEHNLGPVVLDEPLMMAARFYAQTMYTFGALGHNVGPYTLTPDHTHGASTQVARVFGGRLVGNGGNGALGHVNPESVINGWMNSPGHRSLILSNGSNFIGTGRFGGFSYMYMTPLNSLGTGDEAMFDGHIQTLFELFNAERASRGVAPLRWNDSLAHVSEMHNHDIAISNEGARIIIDNNILGSDGSTPTDRLTRAGIPHQTAGQNHFLGAYLDLMRLSPEAFGNDAMEGWIFNRDISIDNIVNPAFTQVGISIYVDLHNYYVTVKFAD